MTATRTRPVQARSALTSRFAVAALAPPRWTASGTMRLVGAFLVIGLIGATAIHGKQDHFLIDLWLVDAIAAVGFYLMFGVAGKFAFSQTFFMALGAYIFALVSAHHSLVLALVLAVLIPSAIAAVFGYALNRVGEFAFSMVTFALTQIGSLVFMNWTWFAGVNATRVNVPYIGLFSWTFDSDEKYFYLLLSALFGVLWIARAIERSSTMKLLVASRENLPVAESLGIPGRRLQLQMFVLGSAMGAFAGALDASWGGFVSNDSFSIDLGIGLFLIVMLGGSRYSWGAPIGAGIYVLLPDILSGFEQYQAIIYGVLLIVLITGFPNGICGYLAIFRNWILRRISGRVGADAPAENG
jgi:branched-chain amino acid transport system permease protein